MAVATFKQPDYNNMTDASEYALAIDHSTAVLAEVAANFAVSERATPDLRVTMRQGKVPDSASGIPILVAAQDSAQLAAPSGNPRHDIVYLDSNNAIGVATGAEAGAPADPALPSGAIAKARIRWTVGMAAITNDRLDDLRLAGGGGGGLWEDIGFFDLAGLGSIDFFGVPAANYSPLWLQLTELKFVNDSQYICLQLGTGGTLVTSAVYGSGIKTIRHRTSAGGETQIPNWHPLLAWPPWAYMRTQPANPGHATDIYIRHMDQADTYTLFDGTVNLQYLQGDHYGGLISGSMFYVGAHDRIHVFPYTGNFLQGKAALRGMKKGG